MSRRRHPLVRLAGTVARLPRYLYLAQALVRDPAVSVQRKSALAAGLGYAVLPFDILPGIIPIVGQLDDLGALLLGIRQALRGLAPERPPRTWLRRGWRRGRSTPTYGSWGSRGCRSVARAAGLARRVVRAPLRLLAAARRRE